ncbi:MAG: choice-of-anchor D domain-containing protein [Chloroflexi bacterium]|nr:choice-of-anchor D domain-containing protein [Chloroflexota bacterium]
MIPNTVRENYTLTIRPFCPTSSDTGHGNYASNGGGGMINDSTTFASLINVSFQNNSAGAAGGGGLINWNAQNIILSRVTFSANSTTGYGGGLYNSGSSTTDIFESTFSGNSATASNGGGLYNQGTIFMRNTIIANSASGGDCVGTLDPSSANNLIEDRVANCGLSIVPSALSQSIQARSTSNDNIVGVDPKLGDFEYNGGSVPTFALLPGSPAIDTGNMCPSFDQRGQLPKVDGDGDGVDACDIGAFEVEPALTLTPSSLNFGEQLFRTSNPPELVTVKNTSGSSITLGTLSGSSSVGTTPDTSKSFFISNDTCSGATLAANAECSFEVTFRPWSLGDKTGSISILSNATDVPDEISLAGASIAGTQLLLNRSYENIDGNAMPTLWSRSPLIKNGIDGTDLSWAFNASRSMKFVGDGDLKIVSQQVNKSGVAGDDFSMFVVTKGLNIPVSSDRWLMQIMFYNGATIVENRNVPLKTGTHEDNRITVMYTAVSNYTHIVFRVHYGKASGTAWVDLASLQWAP